jgi:hypothetical protein
VDHHRFARRLEMLLWCLALAWPLRARAAAADDHDDERHHPRVRYAAPAGNRPASREIVIDGQRAAVLPNGRLLTPAGREIDATAP